MLGSFYTYKISMSKTTELDQAELIEGADQLRKMGIEIHRVDQRWMVFLYPPLDSGVPVIGSGSLELFVDTLVVVRKGK